MINRKNILFVTAVSFFAGAASASALNTEEVIHCAIIEAVSCELRMGCETGGADMVNLPNFVQIDIPGGQVTGNRPDGTELATPIERIENLDGSTIIQGGEEGVGWTILLSEENGNMTVSGSSGDEGLIIFGACFQE